MWRAEVAEFLERPGDAAAVCLRRISQREHEIQAWSQVEVRHGTTEGPLAGLPVGVKDIFETEGLRTEFGSRVFAGRVSPHDSALVKLLRDLGATVIGKTHTTAFAYFDSAPTRNPHNLAHTPGGSSSGSAAAVAAGMVPLALGSQTLGSVLRPASFCGVVGFKPTRALLPLEGVMPFAPSLDTAGFFTQSAAGMRLVWERMGQSVAVPGSSPRIAAFPPGDVEEPMHAKFSEVVARLEVARIDPPDEFRALHVDVRAVQDYEGARTHRDSFERHGENVGAKMAQLVRRGLAMPEEEYEAALSRIRSARRAFEQVFEQFDIILTPAAPGPAPEGFSTTGDPRMNAPWTGLGVPAIAIPMPVEGSLPLGLQMVAGWKHESRLLEAACIVERWP